MTLYNWQERTILLLTEKNNTILNNSNVLVAGLGGVGGYTAEMLCRAGIGRMTIIDADQIQPSNRNRQLLALSSTHGKRKALLMRDRLLDINPELKLTVIDEFIRDERTNEILETPFDYVADAIDTLSPKIFLIRQVLKNKLPLVSSMGAGGKTDPGQVKIADFAETYQCNLARMLRKRLKNLGVRTGFKTVFSPEMIDEETMQAVENEPNKKTTVGTISYMPAIFGCIMASVVIRDLLDMEIELAKRPCRRNSRA
ncbi:MAG: tRNA threonylcarbamoyladenosine dehydratase [Bacteroidetes bacterium]|nr:MAG: tRNA threonylcarbamoyladenosine dehydratase [Bacteroidota bacterium]